jgi:hypothetical protein
MNSKKLVSLFGLGLSVVVGCAAASDDESGATEDQVKTGKAADGGADADAQTDASSANLEATITTKKLEKTSTQCTVAVNFPVVDAKSPAATAAIAKVLPLPTADSFCTDLEATDEFSVDGGFTVSTNSNGILSLTRSEDSFLKGSAHPNVTLTTRSFELKTGKLLKLADVLAPAGVAIVKKACIAALVKVEDNMFDEASATDECTRGLEDSADRPTMFEIEKGGFHLMLDLAHAIFAIGVEGATVPWADLKTSVAPGAMTEWIKAQK